MSLARALMIFSSVVFRFSSQINLGQNSLLFSHRSVCGWASAEAGFFKRSLLESTKIHLKTSLRDLAAAM
jgi:hypothetical protein